MITVVKSSGHNGHPDGLLEFRLKTSGKTEECDCDHFNICVDQIICSYDRTYHES